VPKRDHGIAALPVAVDSGTIDHDNIEAPIVIAVEQADAPADGFHHVPLLWGGEVRNV
jgi:hypothetical protein